MSTTVIDPVCGMSIDPADAAGSTEHQGTTYSFCSKGCLKAFTKDPTDYLGAQHHSHER